MDMPEPTTLLKKKVAGIPVSIIALIFVAALLYMAIKMKSAPTTTDTGTDSGDTAGGDSDGQSGGQPVFVANQIPAVSTGDQVGPAIDVPDQPTDQQWATKAISWLVSAKGASFQTATSAVTKYLSGQQLSVQEGTYRDAALAQFGAPPESGFQPTTTAIAPAPASKQGVPPCTHKVKGQNDNTPGELAMLYYGKNTPDAAQYLQAHNVGKAAPYTVGVVITIPAYHAPKYFRATAATHTLADIAARNAQQPQVVQALNRGTKFPVPVGTSVRVD